MIWGCFSGKVAYDAHTLDHGGIPSPAVSAHNGQSVQQKAAGKTLARKAQADCDAQTARVAQDIYGRGQGNPGVLCFLFAQIYEVPGSGLPSDQ